MNPADSFPPEMPELPPAPRPRFNWWLFAAVLLAPVLVTALSVWLFSKKGDLAPVIAVFGGGLAGIISGGMLGRHFGKTVSVRIMLGVLFAVILGVACITMSCIGCLASGYQLNF